LQLERFNSGEEINVSQISIYPWTAHLELHCQTGNRARSQIIGIDVLNLVIYITAWPDATLDEMAAFIFNEGGELFSHKAISKQLKELEITKKKASAEAYQAQRPDVQFCVWSFWNCPLPLGIFQVPRRKLIDTEEFGVTLKKCNRTRGWAAKVHRVRKDGHYHHGTKITVIFAIKPGYPSIRIVRMRRGSSSLELCKDGAV
jgi:transposase